MPANGVVREEGNGTMTAWVTKDRKRFLQRNVKLGLAKMAACIRFWTGCNRGNWR